MSDNNPVVPEIAGNANDRQVGGTHYKEMTIQHWDFAAANEFDYFQGQVTKYVTRWKTKNGLEDLKKAMHFLQKYIEVVEAGGFSEGKELSPVEQVPVSVADNTWAATYTLVEGYHPSHQMSSTADGPYCRACYRRIGLDSPCGSVLMGQTKLKQKSDPAVDPVEGVPDWLVKEFENGYWPSPGADELQKIAYEKWLASKESTQS